MPPLQTTWLPNPYVFTWCTESTSRLQILPDIDADVTVMGKQHLGMLQIPRSSLQPLPFTHMLTTDGSEMSPALGCCEASLRLWQRSCVAQIQVHKGVQTPLLSYGHCKELAIISQEFPKLILYGQKIVVPAALRLHDSQ